MKKDITDKILDEMINEAFDEYSKEELIKQEFDVFGFYLKAHPVGKYKKYNSRK